MTKSSSVSFSGLQEQAGPYMISMLYLILAWTNIGVVYEYVSDRSFHQDFPNNIGRQLLALPLVEKTTAFDALSNAGEALENMQAQLESLGGQRLKAADDLNALAKSPFAMLSSLQSQSQKLVETLHGLYPTSGCAFRLHWMLYIMYLLLFVALVLALEVRVLGTIGVADGAGIVFGILISSLVCFAAFWGFLGTFGVMKRSAELAEFVEPEEPARGRERIEAQFEAQDPAFPPFAAPAPAPAPCAAPGPTPYALGPSIASVTPVRPPPLPAGAYGPIIAPPGGPTTYAAPTSYSAPTSYAAPMAIYGQGYGLEPSASPPLVGQGFQYTPPLQPFAAQGLSTPGAAGAAAVFRALQDEQRAFVNYVQQQMANFWQAHDIAMRTLNEDMRRVMNGEALRPGEIQYIQVPVEVPVHVPVEVIRYVDRIIEVPITQTCEKTDSPDLVADSGVSVDVDIPDAVPSVETAPPSGYQAGASSQDVASPTPPLAPPAHPPPPPLSPAPVTY
jgi:hypothetical protein